MSYNKIIEVYRITNCDLVSPLAVAPATQAYKHKVGDFLFIVDGEVWIKNNDDNHINENSNEYSLAVYSAEFVKLNKFLFEKIE